MSRPCKKRKICLDLKTAYFRPQGIPSSIISEIILEVDEMEAIRLADFEGKYQKDAAKHMGIARSTFSNIVNRAHAKIAEALMCGKALKINCPKGSGKNY